MKELRCPTCGELRLLSADGWAWHRLVEHPRAGLPTRCPTCGELRLLSADGWAWHRLVEHPRAGLPTNRPEWVRRRERGELPAKELVR